MNTEYLRYILTVDECKSINKAAKRLYIAQPTLSRILLNMEESIGITIFNRNNRGVEVTSEGEVFIKRIKSMLTELDQLENDYFKADDNPDDLSKLIVGAHRSSPALDAFIRYYTEKCKNSMHVNLVFNEEVASDIIEDVGNNILDLGVIHYISSKENEILQKCNDYNLNCILISDDALYVQIKNTHPLAKKKSIKIEDLKPYTHVDFSDDNLSGVNYCSNIAKFNWKVQKKRFLTNSRGALRTFILNSDGYYLGNNAQCELLTLQDTVSIMVEDYPYTVKTAYIYHRNRELTEDERIYLKYLSQIYKNSGKMQEETFDFRK